MRRLFSSAITGYVIFVTVMVVFVGGGQLALHRSEQRDIRRNCMVTQHEWDTFGRLIDVAVRRPTPLAGHSLTAAQRAGVVAAYRESLRASIGPRPTC